MSPQIARTQSEEKVNPKHRTCLQGRKEKRSIVPLRKVVREREKAAERVHELHETRIETSKKRNEREK